MASGRVRYEVDELRGRITFWGECSVHGVVTDRVTTHNGTDRQNAPATNKVGRVLSRHFETAHPDD